MDDIEIQFFYYPSSKLVSRDDGDERYSGEGFSYIQKQSNMIDLITLQNCNQWKFYIKNTIDMYKSQDYTVTFYYYADEDNTQFIINSDGMWDSSNITLTANKTPQLYQKNVRSTINNYLNMYMAEENNKKVYIKNYRVKDKNVRYKHTKLSETQEYLSYELVEYDGTSGILDVTDSSDKKCPIPLIKLSPSGSKGWTTHYIKSSVASTTNSEYFISYEYYSDSDFTTFFYNFDQKDAGYAGETKCLVANKNIQRHTDIVKFNKSLNVNYYFGHFLNEGTVYIRNYRVYKNKYDSNRNYTIITNKTSFEVFFRNEIYINKLKVTMFPSVPKWSYSNNWRTQLKFAGSIFKFIFSRNLWRVFI